MRSEATPIAGWPLPLSCPYSRTLHPLTPPLFFTDPCRVEESFLEQVRSYLNKDVSVDIESMTTPTPQLSSFKQLFYKDCLVLHKYVMCIHVLHVYTCAYMYYMCIRTYVHVHTVYKPLISKALPSYVHSC